MALVALLGALCGLVLLVPSLIAVEFPCVLSPRTGWVAWAFLMSLAALGISFILGLIGMIRIEQSGGRITGRSFAVAAILLPVLGGLLPIWLIIARRPRSVAFRMVCGTNLSGIGKAMLIYSNDYDDQFPRAGGRESMWAQKIPDWTATNRFTAYGLSASGEDGVGTISSCFYLLVKYSEVTPKFFVCTKDKGITEFKPGGSRRRNPDLIDFWDFGPEPWKHYSYSYHMPFGEYALTTSYLPGMAVAADRSPWMDSPSAKARDFSKFDPDGDREAVKAGNTIGHQGDGQNVLFVDSHVGFEKVAFCGVDDDNIFTYWDGKDIRRGAPPVLGSQPRSRTDSMLVHDPPPTKAK